MRDFFRSPLFRCLVCLILVCCILVNVSPIRAKAFAVEATTAVALACIFMLVSAASIGAVYVLDQADVLEKTGQQIAGLLQDKYVSSPTLWYDAFPDWDDWFPPDLPPDNSKFRILNPAGEVLSAAVYSVILSGLLDQMSGTDLYGGYGLMEIVKLYLGSSTYNLKSSESFVGIYYSYTGSDSKIYYGFSSCMGKNRPSVTCNSVTWGVSSYQGYYFSTIAAASSSLPSLGSEPLIPYFDFGSYSGSDFNSDILYPFLIDYFDNALLVEDALLNGTAEQLRNGTLSEDDIEIPAVLDFTAIAAAGNTFEEGVVNTMQQLADGTLSYEEYMDMITPDEVVEPDPTVDPSESTEPTEDPEAIPEDMAPYIFDLREIFPFCIPFDLYDFLTCLNASPVAPVIHWEIQLPGGGSYPLDLDLAPFDSVAQLLRRLQLLAFCIALGIKTRDLIKG